MEALKLKAIVRDGNLLVPVPKELNDQEVEIIVLLEGVANQQADQNNKSGLADIFGKAKYPDFPISKYDVYNQ